MIFTGNDDGLSIEEFNKYQNSLWKEKWKSYIHYSFIQDARIWWQLLDHDKMVGISNEEIEKIILERWYHVKKGDKENTKDLFHVETLYYRFMVIFMVYMHFGCNFEKYP
jgi:hypothetical protein